MEWLKKTGVKSLYTVLDNIDLDDSISIMASCGHGILKPNVVLIGYKNDWFNCTDEDVETYLNALKYVKMAINSVISIYYNII